MVASNLARLSRISIIVIEIPPILDVVFDGFQVRFEFIY